MAGKKKTEIEQVKETEQAQTQESTLEAAQEAAPKAEETKEERQHRLANEAMNMNKNIIMKRTREGTAVQQNPDLDSTLVKMPVIVSVDKDNKLYFSHMTGLNALTALQRNYDTKETSPLWLTASAMKSVGLEPNFPQKGAGDKTDTNGRVYTSGINVIVDANKGKERSGDNKVSDSDKKFDAKTIKLYNLGTLYANDADTERTIRYGLNNSYETVVGKNEVHNHQAALAKELLRELATRLTQEQAEADYKLRGEVFSNANMSNADKSALLNAKGINLKSIVNQSFAAANITVMSRRDNKRTNDGANLSQAQTATRQNSAAR